MPQFIRHGPIVPDKLVQDLEDDRVVIFCGAGISVGAGLPTYRGLVEHCFTELGQPAPSPRHRDWDWPDRMLGFLESRTTPARVRETVVARLSEEPRDLDIHRAILALAKLRRVDGMRLITTNFDTLFEAASTDLRLGRDFHAGPILPIPRNDRAASWRSLVYLHGRLGSGAHHDLVLTSADFGRAYLTEAWAARFVARLFADFTVLFIGYSLNDPVMRYMTDAFAAEDAEARSDQARGPAYIFTAYKGSSLPDKTPYLDRNLEPIFYNEMRHHSRLKQTLVAWAEARSDYLANTAALIRRIAPFRPDAIDPTDTANLLWAVAGRRGDNGHGARTFATVGQVTVGDDKPPPIEWLDAFEARDRETQAAYQQAVGAAIAADRPPPSAPVLDIDLLFPVVEDRRLTTLSLLGHRLIPWLVRHLGSEGLVQRVTLKLQEGRRPHAQLRSSIRAQLQAASLPPGLRRFWRIVSTEGDWTLATDDAHPGRVALDGVALPEDLVWMKHELLAAVRPVLRLEQPLSRRYREVETEEPTAFGEAFRDVAEAEVVLADAGHLIPLIDAIDRLPRADDVWADLLGDLDRVLKIALDLYATAEQANAQYDPSTFQRPSIVPHDQNHAHQGWTRLFDLVWRGWVAIDGRDAVLSRHYVARWRAIPYPGFHRLAVAAMAHSDHFTDLERLELLADG